MYIECVETDNTPQTETTVNIDLSEATREWQERRPQLMKQWREEAAGVYAPYRVLPSQITRYVRQQEQLWWYRKRQEAIAAAAGQFESK